MKFPNIPKQKENNAYDGFHALKVLYHLINNDAIFLNFTLHSSLYDMFEFYLSSPGNLRYFLSVSR